MDTVGIICVTIVGFQLLKFLYWFIYQNLIAPSVGINSVNLKDMGKWAVVTGATDGVGKAYAEELARRGMSVVFISRTQAKLDQVAQEIGTKYQVQTKTIAVDYTQNEEMYNVIDKQLQGMEIGVLVNNVGMSYPHPEYFLENKDSNLYQKIINCNVVSVTNMCRIIMPGMVERRKGVIVNISSATAWMPSPLLTIYAASKAYMEKFSADLGVEYAKHGIIVQCILPGFIATNMSKIRSSTWMAPSPKKFVEKSISTIGVLDKTTGYFAHTLMVMVVDMLHYISPSLCNYVLMNSLQNIRRRALRSTSKQSQ